MHSASRGGRLHKVSAELTKESGLKKDANQIGDTIGEHVGMVVEGNRKPRGQARIIWLSA